MGELSCACIAGTVPTADCILHAHIALGYTVQLLKRQIEQAQTAGLRYDEIHPILRTLSDVGYFVE